MKAKSRKRKGGLSVKQLDQQLKFSNVSEFLSPFGELLYVTFKNYAVDMTAQNAAFSFNFPAHSPASRPIMTLIIVKRS